MKLQNYGFCVLRRPLLSRTELESFHELTGKEPGLFESELRRIFSDPMLLDGLQLASGSLYSATVDWLQKEKVNGKEKLLESLYKFLVRAATRSTPFGLFAGSVFLETDRKTEIIFSENRQISRHNQLDVSILEALKRHVLHKGSLRSQLLFYPSTSLYRAGQTYRFLKRQDELGCEAFIQSQAAAHPVLEKLLGKAKNGMTLSELLMVLHHENMSPRGAEAYLKALVSAQVLVSSLELNVTGPHYLSGLSETLSTLKGTKMLLAKLCEIQKKLDCNESPAQISSHLKGFIKPDHPLERILHTTLTLPATRATISHKVLDDLGLMLGGIEPLARPVISENLQDFTRRFFARYGQQPISLLLALDYDYGTGYGTLSSDVQPGLSLLGGIESQRPEKAPEQYTEDLATELYQAAMPIGLRQVTLTETHLQMLKRRANRHLPDSFSVMGSLHGRSQQAVDRGEFLFELKGLYGPSAANLLTRFCPGNSLMTRHVRRMIKLGEACQDDVIYAEIAHLPTGKAGNIVQRPDLRNFEIAYLANAGRPSQESIRVSDLLISSPDGKSLVLSTPKLEKPIIPVLSSAHNYHTGLPVYRFLCDLAAQQACTLQWDWGKFQDAVFLPRIQYKNIVISKASWLLTLGPKPGQSIKQWWKEMETKMGSPRYFTAQTGDQILWIDSEYDQSLVLLAGILKKEGNLRITESLENPDDGFICKNGNYFTSELVIPYQNSTKRSVPMLVPASLPTVKSSKITRHFTATSSWLYVKIYCSETLTDTLLTGTLLSLLVSLARRRVIEKWFFIRFQDPEPHLRLRCYGGEPDFWIVVFQELHRILEPLLENGMVQSIQTDRYQRELERYTPQTYSLIESFFYRDSVAVTHCLNLLGRDQQLRWQGALLGTNQVFDDMGLTLNGKLDLVARVHEQFSNELDRHGSIRRQMDSNYRAQKQQIIHILSDPMTPGLKRLSNLLAMRSRTLNNLKVHKTMQDQQIRERLTADLVHLFLNRWFYTRQREQEFAVYHYLKKYYTYVLKNKISH